VQVRRRGLQLLTHAGALVPLAALLWDGARNQLGFNPIQEITARTGEAALVLLVLSLACTPLNTLFGWKQLLPLRRPLGLYAFGYVCLHLLTFLVLDFGLEWAWIWQEVSEKRYILVGFTAFLLLLPLALTSTRWSMRRLGKRWKQLHRLVYLAAPLAVVHYLWLVKADIREPLFYGGLVAILLILRLAPVRRVASRWGTRLRRNAGKRSPARTASGG
jgi:methionine sulfoxide reductase heme-binding subunit